VILSTYGFGQFETRGEFLAASGPNSIAVGDFNHDGKLDLAVVGGDTNADNTAILLGNGDGTFRPAQYYTAGVGPGSIVAADFNGDGNLDLAVASQSNYISILLGNGDGTFQPPIKSPPVPRLERFVTAGDFNGDGVPDLVTLGSDVISVLIGNGDGTFQKAVVSRLSFSVYTIGVGDFDRDGILDLAAAGSFEFDKSVHILLGNGDGTFRRGASYVGGNVPVSIAVADFRGDHKLDLAIADSEGTGISVMLGNGDGTFEPATVYPVAFSNWVTTADLNGNGKLDLVVAVARHYSSGVTIFSGNGDGTFQQGMFYLGGDETPYVATGDFNGDRKIDLALAEGLYSDVFVLLNTGTVAFSPTTPLNFKEQAAGTTSAPQVVTLTNNGTTELTISSMKVAGEFAMTSSCGKTLASAANCTISVTFSPQSQGLKSGKVAIDDRASSKPQVIELRGTGT
jgi:hypothetical protein